MTSKCELITILPTAAAAEAPNSLDASFVEGNHGNNASPLVADAVAVEVMALRPLLPQTTPTGTSSSSSPPSTVQVVAPVNLPGGYEFLVDVDGMATLVRVVSCYLDMLMLEQAGQLLTRGRFLSFSCGDLTGFAHSQVAVLLCSSQPQPGAQKGQTFVANIVQQVPSARGGGDIESDSYLYHHHSIPEGNWRDSICGCCSHGCCHPMCCLAMWCQPLALGHVMTRMKLDACGKRHANASPQIQENRDNKPFWSAFKVLAIVLVVLMVVNQSLTMLISPYQYKDVLNPDNDEEINVKDVPVWVRVAIAVQYLLTTLYFFYILVLMMRTRSYIRRRYAIRTINACCCCGPTCEDCCCSFWLPCCTVTQMARHTADYDTYKAACCTDTGLSDRAPHIF